MNEVMIGIVGLFVLLALFLTGIELGFAMAVVGFVGFAYIRGLSPAFGVASSDFFDVFSSYGLTVIPLFVFMGQIAFNAGIAKKLYESAHRFVGHIPGGLGIATVVGATLFKAICGSSTATSATFASVAVPEMERYHYSKMLSTGTVATVGTLGVLIPPSVVLIIFGLLTEQSIGKLFLAGIIPGLIIALFFIGIIIGWAKINPATAPAGPKSSWPERWRSLPEVIWPLIIFFVVMGGLMKGFFTPTEAGSVGTFAVIVLVLLKRNLTFKDYIKSVAESLRTACMVLMLIAGSTVMGHFLAVTKIPMLASNWIVGLPVSNNVVMVLIILLYLLGGSFIDDLAFMVLATPIIFPAAMKLGYDPIWFGMMVAISMMIGAIIPPVAINVFIVKNITKVPFNIIYKGVYPFLIALVVATALLFMFPQIALWLPSVYSGQ
jgi:tripartite ATP-independent transporter DctM subunit